MHTHIKDTIVGKAKGWTLDLHNSGMGVVVHVYEEPYSGGFNIGTTPRLEPDECVWISTYDVDEGPNHKGAHLSVAQARNLHALLGVGLEKIGNV